MNQSKAEENTRSRRQARENTSKLQLLFFLYFWLVEKVAWEFLANHKA